MIRCGLASGEALLLRALRLLGGSDLCSGHAGGDLDLDLLVLRLRGGLDVVLLGESLVPLGGLGLLPLVLGVLFLALWGARLSTLVLGEGLRPNEGRL